MSKIIKEMCIAVGTVLQDVYNVCEILNLPPWPDYLTLADLTHE